MVDATEEFADMLGDYVMQKTDLYREGEIAAEQYVEAIHQYVVLNALNNQERVRELNPAKKPVLRRISEEVYEDAMTLKGSDMFNVSIGRRKSYYDPEPFINSEEV